MLRRCFSLSLTLVVLVSFVRFGVAAQQTPSVSRQTSTHGSVLFIENVGQFADGARFQVWGAGPMMWLAEDAIWLTIVESRPEEVSSLSADPHRRYVPSFIGIEQESTPKKGANIRLSFVGANPHPRLEPFNRSATVVSYFLGDDPAAWRPLVPVWGGVRYVDLYPGIDLEITSEGGQIVQRLDARPSADLRAIRLRVEGADKVALDGNALLLSSAAGEARLPLLQADRHGQEISIRETSTGAFDIAGPFAAAVGRQPATASPQSLADNRADLLYGTFLGSPTSEQGEAIAVDGSGNTCLTGLTNGETTFPTTPGAYDRGFNGYVDVFVVKLNPAGSGLVYATFLGGSDLEVGLTAAADGAGNCFIAGPTYSTDFPTTNGAFDRSHNGLQDAFVAKLNPTGSSLLYATYLGSSAGDDIYDIAIDAAGSVYVTGYACATNFPTTNGGFDRTLNGGMDAFVVKFNPVGSALAYGTFLGGNSSDVGAGIAVDAAGNAYVTGMASDGFPTTAGAWDRSYNGAEAFVAKLNATGSALSYATYLGGNGSDIGSDIAVDGAGSAYVVGTTMSGDFPVTAAAFDRSYNGGDDVFIARLNAAGSGLLYASYLGGSGDDSGANIGKDAAGNVWVTGQTKSSNFPVTVGAFDTSFNGGYYDAFAAKVSPDGGTLLYSTYFGGSGSEAGDGIAIDSAGNAYVIGTTGSADLPTTPGAFQPNYNGNGDAFVAKLRAGGSPPDIRNIRESADPINRQGCAAPQTVTIQADVIVSSAPASVWLNYQAPGGYWTEVAMSRTTGDTYAATIGPFLSAGTVNYYVKARDNAGLESSSAQATVTVQNCYSISGRVTDVTGTRPISGVTIVDDKGHVTTSDSNGNYTLSGLSAGTYTITPAKDGFSFEPPWQTVVVPGGMLENFKARLLSCIIQGTVTVRSFRLKNMQIELLRNGTVLIPGQTTRGGDGPEAGTFSFGLAPCDNGPYTIRAYLKQPSLSSLGLGGFQVQYSHLSDPPIPYVETLPFAPATPAETVNLDFNEATLRLILETTNVPLSDANKVENLALMYHHLHQAEQFAVDQLGLGNLAPVTVSGYDGMSTEYDRGRRLIRIAVADSDSSSQNRPENREWHEYFHHVMAETIMTDTPERACGNHAGFLNNTTADSWIEGWAIFWAKLLGNHLSGSTSDHYSGLWSLDQQHQVWDAEIGMNGEVLQREDLAVAALLWDLHDSATSAVQDADNDHLSLTAEQMRDALLEPLPTGGYRSLADMKDVYDRLVKLYPSSHLDEVFWAHGFFGDRGWSVSNCKVTAQGDKDMQAGEQIGEGGRSGRHDLPHVAGANLLVELQDQLGQPVDRGLLLLRYKYPVPYDVLNVEYQIPATSGALFPLEPPPSRIPVTVEIQGDSPSSPIYSMTNEAFWNAVANSGRDYVAQIKLTVKHSRLYLPLVVRRFR